jgi:transposase-like protein
VLDVLVQSRRNAVAAKRFFPKLLKGLRYVPRVLVTDKLGSYQVAHRELTSSVEHRRSRRDRTSRAPWESGVRGEWATASGLIG